MKRLIERIQNSFPAKEKDILVQPYSDDRDHTVIAFDADGTLWDSYAVSYKIMRKTFDALDMTLSEIEERIGEEFTLDYHTKQVTSDFRGYFMDRLGFGETELAVQNTIFKDTIYDLAKEFRMYDQIPEVIEELHNNNNYTLGIISHNYRPAILKKLVHESIDGTSLAEYFTFVLGYEELGNPKPDPASMQNLAQLLNTPTDQWIYVGDDVVDIDFAKNAGATSVRALYKPYNDGNKHHADYAIHSPEELLAIPQRK